MKLAMITLAVTAASLLSSSASALTHGFVSGQILFYQHQGNFCPSSRGCTGIQYTYSEYNTNMPLSHVKVYVKNGSGSVLGQGTTDLNGNFLIGWLSAGTPSNVEVYTKLEHQDGRFEITDGSGGAYVLVHSTHGSLVDGTSTESPQYLGTTTFGSPSVPHEAANVYDGAWRGWHYALRYSNRMVNNFTGLEIRAFNSVCKSSCANGDVNRVNLDPDAAFSPQARVLHEMGHIASYQADNHRFGSDYNYPTTGEGGSWDLTSREWRAAQFEEGLATFIGDVAINWGTATEPHTCLSAGACWSQLYNVEAYGFACINGQRRAAINVVRYLWDLFDTPAETGDDQDGIYAVVFDVLAEFPPGTSSRQKDEPLNSDYSLKDDLDGRAYWDYEYHWENLKGTTTALKSLSCLRDE